jgi:hypothetical protein
MEESRVKCEGDRCKNILVHSMETGEFYYLCVFCATKKFTGGNEKLDLSSLEPNLINFSNN